MKRWTGLLLLLPLFATAGEFEPTLVVQTGKMVEGDLIIRNITDLGANKTCLAFYIRTSGTSPVIQCYNASSGFGAQLRQVGHIKSEDLIVRKVVDEKNRMNCVVGYVSTPGTSPAVACYPYQYKFKGEISEAGHLREGDLHVFRIVDPANMKVCLVSYVETDKTKPDILCYDSTAGKRGGLYQASYLREGDLIVRKIKDAESGMACLVTYVSTPGTKTHLYCYPEGSAPPPMPSGGASSQTKPRP